MEPLVAGFFSVTALSGIHFVTALRGIHLSTALGGPLLAGFVFVTTLRGIHFAFTVVRCILHLYPLVWWLLGRGRPNDRAPLFTL